MLLQSNNPILDAQPPDQGYSPVARALGVAAVGTAGYQANKYLLRTRPGYAEALHRYAQVFEERTPFKLGYTFRLSERLSSNLINQVNVSYSDVVSRGALTPLGEHFDRLFRGKVDLFSAKEGLVFNRVDRADPYLALEGRSDIRVRFAKRGRLTASSFRYNAPLYDRRLELDFSGPWWKPSRLRANFEQLKQSQIPRGYKSRLHAADQLGDAWFTRIQPYTAKIGEPLAQDLSNLRAAAPDALRSFGDRAGRFLFEQTERTQRLLADVGFGLKAGSYNKVLHVPFVGEGGFVNSILTKRVAPIILGATALGYLDFLTGHVASNAIASVPLKANVLRADATDSLPFARRVTDFYAQVVPGPQYGPLALPVAGAFAGGLYHYAKVLRGAKTGEYAGEARDVGARFIYRGAESENELARAGKSLLARVGEYVRPQNILKTFTEAGHYPGKGLLVGLAAMLPFIPGMLGSRRTGKELRDIYSGKEPVPVKAGRWWDFGTSPYEGGRIKEYRPHWYQLFKSRAEIRSLYGSEKEYWAHNPILHPLRFLRDPYYLEKRHYQDRPYPITSPAFSNVPLIGPLLAATVGKVVKPPVRMHEDVFPGDNYSLYSTRLEPKPGTGLPPPKPREEFGLFDALKKELRQFEEFIGLPGFLFHSARTAVFPNDDIGQDVYFQGSRQMDSVSRRYYERELGAALGPNPGELGAMFGYSEPFRRFVQREEGIAQANEVPNTMPDWLPGDDYFINFRVGDPYAKVSDGFARLPGEGYAALHPEVEGLNPEDYPDIEKLRILGDIAPYSREFAGLRSQVDRASRKNTEMRIEFEKIIERVRKMKDSVIQVDERRFTGDTEEAAGTISRATLGGIELEEYPGRTFHLSSLGYSAADLSALTLGAQNDASKSQIAKEVDAKRSQLQQYFEDNLAPGTQVSVVVPKGSIAHATDIRAVVNADGRNINRDLIASNLALYRKDMGGAEAGSMHSAFGRAIGALAESLSFSGDESAYNPLRYVPTPGHTKLWQERTAFAQYVQQEVIGTKMRRWDRPLHDFVGPYARGAIRRAGGDTIVPDDVQHRRDLNTLTDVLSYLRDLKISASGSPEAGRYTSQAHRTAVGANLFSSPVFVGSTLPDRDSIYFRRFLLETDPDKRAEILKVVPPEMARALQAQWAAQDASIAQAEGKDVPPIGEGGRLITEEGLEEYQQAGTQLDYGDFMRSKEIAEFFARTGFRLPEDDSSVWDEVVDYDDVKLKILQTEGYDMHDFNIFEDRAALLWRKPWLDGAARELTSGNRQSVENLRRSVEQMLLASGHKNPNARAVAAASSRPLGHVRVDGTIEDDKAFLRELRRNPEQFDSE